MAKDIKLSFVSTSEELPEGDFKLVAGDIETDKGLGTSVIVSLFTDRRADIEDNPDNGDRKGWWGDLLSDIEDDKIGSKLYLLDRSKATNQTVIKAKEYIFEALEWMIEDGIAEEIDIDTWIFGDVWNRRLGALIKIYKKVGGVEQFKFDDLWSYTDTIGVRNAI
jgi:phage gp46-like protein